MQELRKRNAAPGVNGVPQTRLRLADYLAVQRVNCH
jgi:hypothetical protein